MTLIFKNELFSNRTPLRQRFVYKRKFRSFELIPSVLTEDSMLIELFHSLELCLIVVVQSSNHMAFVQVTVGEEMSKTETKKNKRICSSRVYRMSDVIQSSI